MNASSILCALIVAAALAVIVRRVRVNPAKPADAAVDARTTTSVYGQ